MATALASGGLGLAILGLDAGIAQAHAIQDVSERTCASCVGFDPQPDPPRDPGSRIQVGSPNELLPAVKGFDPQPDPPGAGAVGP